jgi:hypothetical protein
MTGASIVQWRLPGLNGGARTGMQGSWPSAEFPNLTYGKTGNHKITSVSTLRYNCIGWAADDPERWWWPNEDAFWPLDLPERVTINDFILAFESLGYRLCADGSLEDGCEKIALYARIYGNPTHAARQLANGKWTSKLGPFEDIQHESPDDVNGPVYGSPACFMKRARAPLTPGRIAYLSLRLVRVALWELRTKLRETFEPDDNQGKA